MDENASYRPTLEMQRLQATTVSMGADPGQHRQLFVAKFELRKLMDVSGIGLFTQSTPKEPKVVGYVRSWHEGDQTQVSAQRLQVGAKRKFCP